MTCLAFNAENHGVYVDLVNMCKDFVEESDYPVEFDYHGTVNTLAAYSHMDTTEVLYIEGEDGKAKGGAILMLDDCFTKEPFGYIVKFYVRPEFRGQGVGRELLSHVEEWFAEKKTVANFATATAGIGQDKLFINLFKKFGYIEIGPTLYKGR